MPANKAATKQQEPSGFMVDRYLVDGNTLLSDATIEAVLEKHKGTGKQFKDLDQARMDLEKAYHEAGYPTVLVMLPEQTGNQIYARGRLESSGARHLPCIRRDRERRRLCRLRWRPELIDR